jgi:hypothetical protein
MITTDLDGRVAPQIMIGTEDKLGANPSSVSMCQEPRARKLEDHHIVNCLPLRRRPRRSQ